MCNFSSLRAGSLLSAAVVAVGTLASAQASPAVFQLDSAQTHIAIDP